MREGCEKAVECEAKIGGPDGRDPLARRPQWVTDAAETAVWADRWLPRCSPCPRARGRQVRDSKPEFDPPKVGGARGPPRGVSCLVRGGIMGCQRDLIGRTNAGAERFFFSPAPPGPWGDKDRSQSASHEFLRVSSGDVNLVFGIAPFVCFSALTAFAVRCLLMKTERAHQDKMRKKLSK